MIKNLPTSWTKLSKAFELFAILVSLSLAMPKKTTPEALTKGDSENCFKVVDGLVGALIVA